MVLEDYVWINKNIVKNKFPIPLMDDLLDELHSSSIFSKIDLRARYNQVRMDLGDVYNMTFKNYARHYEYIVMPFGLTNTPTTFQRLTNSVFLAISTKFSVVFFNDILIYNTYLGAYLHHLSQVFLVLRENSLFAKKSKCFFVVNRVEYLGHFISK